MGRNRRKLQRRRGRPGATLHESPNHAANGGIASLLQSARPVAVVAELGSLERIVHP